MIYFAMFYETEELEGVGWRAVPYYGNFDRLIFSPRMPFEEVIDMCRSACAEIGPRIIGFSLHAGKSMTTPGRSILGLIAKNPGDQQELNALCRAQREGRTHVN